jgi:hypothetical protein
MLAYTRQTYYSCFSLYPKIRKNKKIQYKEIIVYLYDADCVMRDF